MPNPRRLIQYCAITTAICAITPALFAVRPPPADQVAKTTADLAGTDATARDAAIQQIHTWVEGGWISMDVWRKWLPVLMKAGKYDDVADIALTSILYRPGDEAISPLLEFRVNALLAEGKNADALIAAKMYYNACALKYTPKAVDLLSLCLARTHPDDGEIVRTFRNAQAQASVGVAASSATQPAPLLKTITIDDKPFTQALKIWSTKTRFSDRLAYGNLLLAADQGPQAEKVFRELFQLAATQKDLAAATEGIAKSLRAQDGNLARANTWLASLQSNPAK